jgi:predicted TIM-barrel fold metal-dependent hydrolase
VNSQTTIDTHRHYLPEALFEAFSNRTELPRMVAPQAGETGQIAVVDFGGAHRSPVLATMRDIDLQLAGMDEFEIDLAILAGTLPGVDELPLADAATVASACNDELADLCRAHPDRLRALAVLPMLDPEAAAAELHRAVGLGMVGAQIFSNVHGHDLYEDQYRPVFEAAAELDIPIRVHPTVRAGAGGLDSFSLRGTLGHVLDSSAAVLGLIFSGLFDRHPDFKLILPHVGGVLPYLIARCDYEAARIQPRLGAAMSATPPGEGIAKLFTDSACSSPESLGFAIDRLGVDRVMIGTDFPLWRLEVTAELVGDLALDQVAMDALLSGTASKLFGVEIGATQVGGR